jgi:Gas vesicle synthesis protein GvpL/GvpF
MKAGDESFERLRAAIDELATAEAAELLADARAEARARVRAMLTEAIADATLERIREQLESLPRGQESRTTKTSEATSPPQATSSPSASSTGQFGWYLYGVVRAAEEVPAVHAHAVDRSQEIVLVMQGGLAAVASAVALEDFEEAPLRRHLADMAWVENTARAHEHVLQAIRLQTTVVPMRMCTVYRDEDGVQEMLRREADALEQALGHLEGRTEWGIKAFFDPALEHELAAQDEPPLQGSERAGTGAAYLERRRRERDREEQAALRYEDTRNEIHESLSAVSADGVVLPAQAPQASGRASTMILNSAYLVDDSEYEVFKQETQELASRFAPLGIELELTGPWPAYNFVPGAIGAAW